MSKRYTKVKITRKLCYRKDDRVMRAIGLYVDREPLRRYGHSKLSKMATAAILNLFEIRGYEKLQFLLQKAHPCVNTRRLSHFVSKLVGWSDPEKRAGKKTKVSDSHRNDVSSLTQDLHYRAACDGNPTLSDFFPLSALEVRLPNRFGRKVAQTTWIHAGMCLLQ